MADRRRRLRSFVVWCALLVGLWLALVGTSDPIEATVGVAAAALVAAAVTTAQELSGRRFDPDPRRALRAWKLPYEAVLDFGVVTLELARALATRRPVEGVFVRVPFDAGGDNARDAWWRAFAAAAGNATPNGLVVDIEPGGDTALMHSLNPRVHTGRKVV